MMLSVWENRFECHAYGPWGAPSLLIGICRDVNRDTATTTLTARCLEPPVVELDIYYEDPLIQDYDPRAAWIVTTATRTKVSVSNTVYRSSVFTDASTGRNIPETAFSYTGPRYDTKYLYLCYGHPNGTTVGWVKIGIWDDQAWVDSSCIATGVYSLKVALTTYTLWPVDPATFLNGGIRQLDIFVGASAAAGGTGLSWESPFRMVQEAVDAVRLDGTVVHVKPGVYDAVTVDNTKFVTNHLAYTFTVQSTDGPEKTIIDGGGLTASDDGNSAPSPTSACFWYGDNPVPLYDTIRGFTLRNSIYGVYNGNVEQCIVSNCWIGVLALNAVERMRPMRILFATILTAIAVQGGGYNANDVFHENFWADRLPLPLVVYDMPAHTDTIIDPATIARFAAHPNIAAMKDSSALIALFNKFRIALEPFADKFSLFMGPDEATGEAVLLGADGGVCTGANLWPAQFKAMYLAAKAGDAEEVRRLQRFTTMSSYLLYGLGQGQIGFLKGVKAALAEMGLIQNVLAAPFEPFGGKELVPVRAALRRLRAMRPKRLNLSFLH